LIISGCEVKRLIVTIILPHREKGVTDVFEFVRYVWPYLIGGHVKLPDLDLSNSMLLTDLIIIENVVHRAELKPIVPSVGKKDYDVFGSAGRTPLIWNDCEFHGGRSALSAVNGWTSDVQSIGMEWGNLSFRNFASRKQPSSSGPSLL
jgi:hypothetical protein